MGCGVPGLGSGGAARSASGWLGKIPSPGGGPGLIKEGDDAASAIAAEQRRTTSRRDLRQRHASFAELSPEQGQLDVDAVEGMVAADADETLAMLADASGATDHRLRSLATSLASRLALDLVAASGSTGGSVARLRTAALPETGGDIDLDASLDAVRDLRRLRQAPRADELRGPVWRRSEVAWCLVVDRSGSMGGERLATAAVAASAVALRAIGDFSVIAFSDEAVVVKGQSEVIAPESVVARLLALRGHGPTDLALGLRAARLQLAHSRAARKVTVLLSDCRATAGEDPCGEARLLSELAIIAPTDDDLDARQFAIDSGARIAFVDGPSSVPRAFAALFER